jgi:hypothetical protein
LALVRDRVVHGFGLVQRQIGRSLRDADAEVLDDVAAVHAAFPETAEVDELETLLEGPAPLLRLLTDFLEETLHDALSLPTT